MNDTSHEINDKSHEMNDTFHEMNDTSHEMNNTSHENSSVYEKPKKEVKFGLTRNLSIRGDDSSVIQIDDQEKYANEYSEKLKKLADDLRINPKNYRRINKYGEFATNHRYSGSTYRDVVFDDKGNIIDNDPDKLWTTSRDKKTAEIDLLKSINLVKNGRKLYNDIIETNLDDDIEIETPDGIRTTVGEFKIMFNDSLDSIPEKYMPGGKKSKKNRKTKRKNKKKMNKSKKKSKKNNKKTRKGRR